MTTVDLDDQAEFLTEVQRACRIAVETRARTDLLKAAALIDSYRFGYLPAMAQEDLHFAYAEAVQSVTGFGA